MKPSSDHPAPAIIELQAVYERLMKDCHSGSEPVEPLREFLAEGSKYSVLPGLKTLAEHDLDKDFREYEQEYLKGVRTPAIPSQIQCLMFWIVGHGPDYPMNITGQKSFPEPVSSNWVSKLPDDSWGTKNWPESQFLKASCQIWEEAMEQWAQDSSLEESAPLLDEDDIRDIDEMILRLYVTFFVSHMASKHRNLLLGEAGHRYIVYGFHGEGDITVAGRISRDKGWESIEKLLETSAARKQHK